MNEMLNLDRYKNRIIAKKIIPAREGVYASFPKALLPEIKAYLTQEMGIFGLYAHQYELFEKAQDGKNIVITTSTASGKTLGFLLPILQEILKNPQTRAILIYPTKALASDQLRNLQPILEYFGRNKIQAGVYDGDTPVNERSRIRSSANIILTNPDMINSAFLPNHNNFGFNFIFSNLKYVVIDELHTYRGAFGSHFANIFRRLERICRYYNSTPQFICNSATIANPIELAQNICGKPFVLIDRDGSPASQKNYYVWQPPMVKGNSMRVSSAREASEFIADMAESRRHFIAFCKSRKTVEVILKEARDKLRADGIGSPDLSARISGYRGGYKPEERKEIERRMVEGELNGLVSTNALELGIDIGRIDSTVIVGFPGTRASFWQQSGRAGRKGNVSSTFLILDNLPFDQYVAIDPEWLFGSGSENAVVDQNNLFIQLSHIRAAAAESPLSLDDIALFPDLGEIVPVLLNAKELKNENGRFVWSGGEYPAGDYSLRNMDKTRYKLKDEANDAIITEMDELQAFRELYKGAIYMHDGFMYLVSKLDTQEHFAQAKAIDVNYYTMPHDIITIKKIKTLKENPVGRTGKLFGDVKVTASIEGYKMLQFHNHQNLGYESLDSTLSKSFETEGFWIRLPKNVSDVYKSLKPVTTGDLNKDYWKDYFDGLAFTLLNAGLMLTMTTWEDLGVALMNDFLENEPTYAICIFDRYMGGLGFSEKVYDFAAIIVENAMKMVKGCTCKDGCPACVGDYSLDKRVVLWGLENIFEELNPPKDIKIAEQVPKHIVEKKFKLETLPQAWLEFVELIKTTGEYLTGFLATVPSVRVEKGRLYLMMRSLFFRSWISDPMNNIQLRNLIINYVDVPANFALDYDVEDDEQDGQPIDDTIGRRLDEQKKQVE